MRFELDDETVLRVGAAGAGIGAVTCGFAAKWTHDTNFTSRTPFSEPLHKYIGLGVGGCSALMLGVAASDGSAAAKKNTLKIAGAVFLGSAALDAYHAHTGELKKDALAMSAINTALGALSLWRGFKSD